MSGRFSKEAVVKKATDEFKEFVVVAVYLYVFFAALIYLKAAILQSYGIAYSHFGLAAVKALICAKFVLIGRAFRLGERYKNQSLVWPTLYKSMVFLVFLLALNAAEEIVVGLIHRRPVAESIANLGGGTLPQIIATSFMGLLILIPFFAFRALGEVLGERNLFRLFFSRGGQGSNG
ncbi:MAG TPA: hypothetical protein VEJ37_01020 [Xanthobacteraceae bacterium]|nr:hypothetical protein [Xanthobacteraceae bacterium]